MKHQRRSWSLGVIAVSMVSVLCVAPCIARASISLLGFAKTSSGSNLVENITLAMPSVPAAVICLAQLATSGDNVITAPPGWTEIRADINAHDATEGMYWHLSTTAEPQSYTWTTGGAIFYEGVIACYSGVNPTAPIDPGSLQGSGAVGHGTALTAPGIRLQTGGDLIIGAFQVAESSWGQNVSINLPPSLTLRWSATDEDASFEAMASGEYTKQNNGLADGLTITTNNGRAGDALIAEQVALQPEHPGSAPPPSASNISYLASTATASGGAPAPPSLTMPSSYAVPPGSVCVAALSTLGANTLIAPAGWHEIRVDTIGYEATQGLYWHATGSDEPPEYTWDAGGDVYYEGAVSCYYGVNPNSPLDQGAPNGGGSATNGTSVAAPSITTLSSGDLIFAAFMAGESDWNQGVAINLASGLTQRFALTDIDTPYMSSAAGDMVRKSSGATDSLTVTTVNGLASDGLLAQEVALQPINANPSPTASVSPSPLPTTTPSATPTAVPTATATASPASGIFLDGFARTAGGGSLTATITLNMPASIRVGDICIAHLAVSGPNNLRVPPGWSTIREDINGYNDTQGLYWHLATGNDALTYEWSTFNGQVLFEGTIGCFAGVNQTTPLDPASPNGVAAVSNGTTITTPSLTTESDGDLIIAAATGAESSWGQGLIIRVPDSTTTLWSASDSSADYLANVAGAAHQTIAGAVGSLTFNTVNGRQTDALVAQVIALQPIRSN